MIEFLPGVQKTLEFDPQHHKERKRKGRWKEILTLLDVQYLPVIPVRRRLKQEDHGF